MSAIAGLVTSAPLTPAPGATHAMLNRIEAPGVSVRRAWASARVALEAKSVRDAHPLHVDDEIVVAGDCRLDNRDELCRQLGLVAANTGDTTIIAAAYRAWDGASAGKLEGEFAFALWDRRRGKLVCARDRFGIKPFYYRVVGAGLRFASEAKALVADGEFSDVALNQSWVVDYAAGLLLEEDATPYVGIMRLPAASWLEWRDRQFEISKYWSLDVWASLSSRAGAPVLVREALGAAVRRRLSGAKTAGFLSGGLDSSSVCCLAREASAAEAAAPFSTISLVFDDNPAESERAHIEDVLAGGGFSPAFINVDNYRPLRALPRLIAAQDGPFLAPGLPLMEHAYAWAGEHGFEVILDGHGGDEVISSAIGRLHELARAKRWHELALETGLMGSRAARTRFRCLQVTWDIMAMAAQRVLQGG